MAIPAKEILGAVGAIGGGVLGMIGQNRREKRAMKNQQKLMDIQQQNQMELNEQGQRLQMQTWKDTNYPAQMEMLREAGLNPALIYGMSGGGGTTTGSQGGGSAAGGNAPSPQPMEIQQMVQTAMNAAQLKLVEAQANKADAEADSIRGEEGTIGESQIAKLIAEAKTEEEKRHLTAAQNTLATTQAQVAANNADKVLQEINNLQESLRGIEMQNDITEATKDTQIDAIGAELMNTLSKTELQDEQARQIWHSILQQWVAQGMKGLDILVKGRFGDIGSKLQKSEDRGWRKGFTEGTEQMKR